MRPNKLYAVEAKILIILGMGYNAFPLLNKYEFIVENYKTDFYFSFISKFSLEVLFSAIC